MTPLTRATLHGVWGTVLLPLEDDDSIDWGRLEAQIRRLASSELDGLYAHGTAGELHTLSEDEFDRITAILADVCASRRMTFQVGVSHPFAQVTIDRIDRTRAWRPAAFQVTFPDWLPLSGPECETFLRRVATVAAPVPLVLYNPPHAKTVAGPELMLRLLDAVPEVIGLKLAGGDGDWYTTMSDVLARCAVFVPGHQLASGFARGARGSYSNIAALSPAGAAQWYATMRDDPVSAADLENRIADFFAQHVQPLQQAHLSSPALDKFLAAVGGWDEVGLRIRWPYASVHPERVVHARRSARSLLPELFGA